MQPDTELAIPLGGLGNYDNKVRNADPLETASEDPRGDPQLTGDQIQNMLDGAESVEEEAMFLAENTHTHYLHSAMQEYHKAKSEGEDMVVANINWSFTSDSEPIIEYHTVEDGELQGQPIIADANTEIQTHSPGEEGPDYLKALRTDDRYTRIVPQDYDALTDRVERGRENGGTEEDVKAFRETIINEWSNALFGTESEPNLIPHDSESSNVVFDGLYHGENTEAVVQLNNQYAESEHFGSDEIVSAQYTGTGWEFEVQEDYEMGDELPAHQ